MYGNYQHYHTATVAFALEDILNGDSRPSWSSLQHFQHFNPRLYGNEVYVQPGTDNVKESIIYFVYFKLSNVPLLLYVGKAEQGSAQVAQFCEENNLPVDEWRYIPVPADLLDKVLESYVHNYRPALNYDNNLDYVSDTKCFVSQEVFSERRGKFLQYLWDLKELESNSALPTDIFSYRHNGETILKIPGECAII